MTNILSPNDFQVFISPLHTGRANPDLTTWTQIALDTQSSFLSVSKETITTPSTGHIASSDRLTGRRIDQEIGFNFTPSTFDSMIASAMTCNNLPIMITRNATTAFTYASGSRTITIADAFLTTGDRQFNGTWQNVNAIRRDTIMRLQLSDDSVYLVQIDQMTIDSANNTVAIILRESTRSRWNTTAVLAELATKSGLGTINFTSLQGKQFLNIGRKTQFSIIVRAKSRTEARVNNYTYLAYNEVLGTNMSFAFTPPSRITSRVVSTEADQIAVSDDRTGTDADTLSGLTAFFSGTPTGDLSSRSTQSLYIAKRNGTISFTRAVSGNSCLLYTSPSPRDRTRSRMPSSA